MESAGEGDECTWFQIGKELEDVGITPSMIEEHKDFIVEWMKRALLEGKFDEATPFQEDNTPQEHAAGASVPEDTLLRLLPGRSHGLDGIHDLATSAAAAFVQENQGIDLGALNRHRALLMESCGINARIEETIDDILRKLDKKEEFRM